MLTVFGFAGTMLPSVTVWNAKSPGKVRSAVIPPPPPVNKLNCCGLGCCNPWGSAE